MKKQIAFTMMILMLLAVGILAGMVVYTALFGGPSITDRQFWVNLFWVLTYVITAIVALIALFFAVGLARQSRGVTAPQIADADLLPVTIIVPTLNEAKVLETCVESLMASDFPMEKLEVFIAYEKPPRCSDGTPEIAARLAKKYPNVIAIPNEGTHVGTKAGACNCCLPYAKGRVIGLYDADHVVHKDAIRRASAQFTADPLLGCIGGKLLVRNMDYNLFTFIIGNEYTVINNFSRFFSELVTGAHLIYGSNVFIHKDALERIGGFDEKSLTEDSDLGMRLINMDYRMIVDYTIESYEQPAINWHDWWSQRVRWTRGSVDTLKKYLSKSKDEINSKVVQTAIVYSLGTIGLLLTVILMGFVGYLLLKGAVPPEAVIAFGTPFAILFAAESLLQMSRGRGSVADLLMSIFIRPWFIFPYTLVGVYAVVLDLINAPRTWEVNQRIG
ncbi:MAG TPA: glycosyltransferase family 2 protein [Methanocella sp.]|jgi:cellulose synthase/poly-beta-1,6-N-acetylglucosamine synthase-like glycosyltransferase